MVVRGYGAMKTIHVKYSEVYAEAAKLKQHVANDIRNYVDSEYRQIQMQLRSVDGAANARLQEAMVLNRQKAVDAANILDELLDFICTSTRQIEIAEQRIERVFLSSRK